MPESMRLTLTMKGPLVDDHRLPLSELQRVAQHLRGTLRNIAVVLTESGPSGQGGRVEKHIEDAADLRVVGSPRAGSFCLELEAPPDKTPTADPLPVDGGPHLAERTMRAFLVGMSSISDESDRLPQGFDRGVLQSVEGFRQSLRRGITDLVFDTSDAQAPVRTVQVNREKLDVAKRLISRPVKGPATVEGSLRMVDDATLECRIERPPFSSVTVFFREEDRDVVWEAGQARKYVRVSGEGSFYPGEHSPRRLQATSIAVIYEAAPFDPTVFWERKSLDAVAEERHVRPFRLQTDDEWRDDDEAEAFIAALREDN